jgi:hypothetical protein
MNRTEHVNWCKKRANEYLDQNNITDAWGSMVSDLGKHEETAGHIAIELGMIQMLSGNLSSVSDMREYINGFN